MKERQEICWRPLEAALPFWLVVEGEIAAGVPTNVVALIGLSIFKDQVRSPSNQGRVR